MSADLILVAAFLLWGICCSGVGLVMGSKDGPEASRRLAEVRVPTTNPHATSKLSILALLSFLGWLSVRAVYPLVIAIFGLFLLVPVLLLTLGPAAGGVVMLLDGQWLIGVGLLVLSLVLTVGTISSFTED